MAGDPDGPTGLVLAGGVGRRLGRAKGSLRWGGRTLAVRAVETLAPLCRGTLVSIAAGADNPAPAVPALEDPPPAGRGPLVGIDAAFRHAGAGDLLVLACDYPRVDTDLLRALIGRAADDDELALPVDSSGRSHPLVALWRRPLAARVRLALEQSVHAVHAVVDAARVGRLLPDDLAGDGLDRLLVNVNAPADLKRLED